MSDLLSVDLDSREFIDRLCGNGIHFDYLAGRQHNIARETEKRLDGITRQRLMIACENGEGLLRKQEQLHARGDTFERWFAEWEGALGFSSSSADRWKKAAARLRAFDGDFDLAFQEGVRGQESGARPPLLAVTMRLTKPVEELSGEECDAWLTRARPVLETAHAIEERRASLKA